MRSWTRRRFSPPVSRKKHGIDLAEVDKADNPTSVIITHKVVWEGARVPDEAIYSSLIVKRFFEVNQLQRQKLFLKQMVLIGTEQHITIAEYVFDFLRGEFSRAWNRRRNKRIKARKRFIYGCYTGLFQKLWEQFGETTETTSALVVSWKAKREQYVKDNFGEVESTDSKPKNINGKAAHIGFHAGQEIEIRSGVDAGAQPAGQLNNAPKQLTF